MGGSPAAEEEKHNRRKTTTAQAMSGQEFHGWGGMIRSKVGWRQMLYGSIRVVERGGTIPISSVSLDARI